MAARTGVGKSWFLLLAAWVTVAVRTYRQSVTGALLTPPPVSPHAVAQMLLPPPAEWQRALPLVRRAAVRLALDGRLMIYRKGKPVDPSDFRGVYRLGLPQDG